jgi:hypothetical protein
MRSKAAVLLSLLAGLPMGLLLAQEGHPLAGTWHGEWHPAAGQKTRIVMYMHWDGQNIVGIIDPGPNAIALKTATFQGWNVHWEADTKNNVHLSADGKMDNVGSYHRIIKGTWTQGSSKGDFTLTRD